MTHHKHATGFRPLSNAVLVLPKKRDEKTVSGLYIPLNASDEATVEATVVAVGPGLILDNGSVEPMSVVQGDRVLYARFDSHTGHETGFEIELEGEKYRVVYEDEIFGVLG